ncbi:MAG: crossover junction endodeoxyribonuclease RuvC, partial [Tepidiformaceae bacterium]
MRVLGIDPGTTVTGYAVVDAGPGNGAAGPGLGRLIECGVISCGRERPLPHRLAELHEG